MGWPVSDLVRLILVSILEAVGEAAVRREVDEWVLARKAMETRAEALLGPRPER